MTIHLKQTALLLIFSFIFLTAYPYEPGKVSFTVTIDGIPTNLNTFSTFVLPGDTVIMAFSGNTTDQSIFQYTDGRLLDNTGNKRRFIPPEAPGHYTITVLNNNPPEKFVLNVFVLVPATQIRDERLNGYRIGSYPKKLFRGNPEYKAPEGFIEVTPENQDTYISPHFQLKQFLCKQQPDQWPKYMLMGPKLLIKLELLLERLNEKGIVAETVFIMSGYRTPWYNASIGNGRYSRHVYGDAADVYIDHNLDGEIDDLNRDGKASMADADVIYQVIEQIERDPQYKYLVGGMGKYKKTSTHTWDVHIDTRGYRARW